MANHRAAGRAQVRPLHVAQGTRRNSQFVSASAAKVGVLGALATATIAVPLASAAANQGEALPASVEAAAQAAPAQKAQTVAAQQAQLTQALPAATAANAQAASFTTVGSTASVLKAEAPAPEVDPTNTPEGKQAEEQRQVEAVASNGSWVKPTPGAPVTSPFGYRIHPTLGYRKMHNGVDFGANCGTPVHAAQAGTVVEVRYHHASGNRLVIEHANGSRTHYYHLSSFKASVGDVVSAGDVVGTVGNTGRSTGCHLHFGLEKGEGNFVNPMSLWN